MCVSSWDRQPDFISRAIAVEYLVGFWLGPTIFYIYWFEYGQNKLFWHV